MLTDSEELFVPEYDFAFSESPSVDIARRSARSTGNLLQLGASFTHGVAYYQATMVLKTRVVREEASSAHIKMNDFKWKKFIAHARRRR